MNIEIILSEEQQLAVSKILEWMDDPMTNQFKLGGYAGTGKTTVIKAIRVAIQAMKKYVTVSAFTGKAVNVLQRKGIDAQTLHSLMYDTEILKGGGYSFTLKTTLESLTDLIIVDEASMISTELYRDLLSFDKKYLFVGDPGQLEPVGDNPNLMAHPDFVLSKIHRQAESSPIITLANRVRLGGGIISDNTNGLLIKGKQITSPEFLAANQVIVARNTTRKSFNDRIRIYKRFPVKQIVEGDKLICLRNAPSYGVFNGSILFVQKVEHQNNLLWDLKVKDESDREFKLPVWKEPFMRELSGDFRIPKDTVYCDFGYAITCHKSQGSEWDKVIVWDEPVGSWDMKRWRYTAITRAAKELTYCI